MNKIALFLSFTIFALSANIEPQSKIVADAPVKDMVLRENRLIIGTTKSLLEVYDLEKKEFTKKIIIPKIKDFMGDTIDARVASVDFIDGRYLLLSDSGVGGYSNLRIHENNKTIDIITAKDKKAIVKARFVDKEHILLGFLSDEIALFSIKERKEIYRSQLTESKFADFALNEDRSLVAASCESGEITVAEVKSGKVIKRLSSQNVDTVYKVDIKKDFVVGGGKDRRASWYNIKNGKGGYFKANFFVYASALSPSTSLTAYSTDENSDITVYNLDLQSKKATLKGQKGSLNTIIFKDENLIYSASDDKTILEWKLN